MDFRIDQEKEIGYITLTNMKEADLKEIVKSNIKEVIIEYKTFDNYDDWDTLAVFIENLLRYSDFTITLKGVELPKTIYSEIKTSELYSGKKINIEEIGSNELLNIETDKYKVEDGVLTWINNSIKDIQLPEGIINIPNHIFDSANNLESITIPKTVKIIHRGTFSYCESLKEVKLSDGLIRIDDRAFKECKNLESIILPKTVKYISPDAFSGCSSLKRVTLLSGLENIYGRSFKNCRNLKEIIIPSSAKHLGGYIFEKCNKLENITIRYKNYEELSKLIDKNIYFFCTKKLYKHKYYGICVLKQNIFFSIKKSINLIFEGPELNDEQKREIISMKIDKKARLFFKVNNNIEQTEKEDIDRYKKNSKEKTRHIDNLDKDIEDQLNKINNLCSYLSDEVKNNISNMVETLLDNYKKELNDLRPGFRKNNRSILEFSSSKDVKLLKPVLLANLESIILNLSSADNLIGFLEELNNYKKLLDTDIDSLSESDSVEDNIKNIIYLSKYLDNEVLDELSKCIEDTINKVSLNITKMYSDNESLLLNYTDYKQEFSINISNLYDEVNNKFNRIGKYKMILDSLTSEEYDFSDGNGIIDTINSTRYIISELSNSNYKKILEEEFNKIKQKYIEIINNIINDEEVLDNTNYEEFEKSLRKELTPLLEEINKYAYLDEYEKDKANNTNILNQLIISKEIIESRKTVKLSEEYSLQPITSYVIEINNKILSNNGINDNDKNKIREELKNTIDNNLSLIENEEIDSIDKYNEILKSIIKSLIDVDYDIDELIGELEEYKKYYK